MHNTIQKLKQVLQENKWQLGLFAVIFLINLFIFSPSFSHIARSDHIVYLANTIDKTDWFSLAVKSYSYDRTPQVFSENDSLLFRPVVFFLLGTEKFFFGYNFTLWQITGFLLHMLVVWLLLRLLLQLHKSIFAGLLTLLFSVLLTGIEMVVWQHVNSYLLFLACIIAALGFVLKIISTDEINKKHIMRIACLILLATFTYELGALYALIFFGFLFLFSFTPRYLPKKNAFKYWKPTLLFPFVFYIAFNLLDFFFRNANIASRSIVFKSFNILATVQNMFISIYWWIYSGLFPNLLRVRLAQRTMMVPLKYDNAKEFFTLSNVLHPTILAGLLSILVLGYVILRYFSRAFLLKRWKFIVLVLILWLAQIGLIIVGRVNPVGISMLANNPYYAYFFWIYPLIIIYAAIDFDKTKSLLVKIISIGLLLVLIVSNGYRVYDINSRRARSDALRFASVKQVQKLKKAHAHENDFTFGTRSNVAFNLPWVKKINRNENKIYTFLELLFQKEYRRSNPKYYLNITQEELLLNAKAILENNIFFNPYDIKSMIFLKSTYAQLGEKENEQKMAHRIAEIMKQRPRKGTVPF